MYDSLYLAHYGIKGQKWGVRRFQNEDRSLTPEGKERYRKSSSEESHGQRITGSISGKTGGMPTSLIVKEVIASVVIDAAMKAHRLHNAKKDVEKAELNKNETRVTKENLNAMTKYSRKERHRLIDRMKENPDLTFDESKKQADKEYKKRVIRNTVIAMAASLAVPVAFLVTLYKGDKISSTANKAKNSILRNKTVQESLKKIKFSKMKNAVVLKDSEFSIDKILGLP